MDTAVAESKWTQGESSAKSNPLMTYEYVWSWHPVLELLLNVISAFLLNKQNVTPGVITEAEANLQWLCQDSKKQFI